MFEARVIRGEFVAVMMTKAERRAMEKYAAAANLSLSSFGRLAIGEEVNRRVEAEGARDDSARDDSTPRQSP